MSINQSLETLEMFMNSGYCDIDGRVFMHSVCDVGRLSLALDRRGVFAGTVYGTWDR